MATAAVAGVLLVGGVALVLVQRDRMIAGLDQTLTQRADDLAALLETERPLPRAFAGTAREGFVQLVAADGTVLVSTPNLGGVSALPVDGSTPGDVLRTVDGLPVDDDVFRVLTRAVGPRRLHVATSFDVIAESTAVLTLSLALILPGLVVVLAGLVWWLVGRTLGPVERIRAEVAEIGATDLARRVPRPGTRDEIDRLATTMNKMLERLQTAVGRQQRFVADASHELRSPLTRMRSELEIELAGASDTRDRAVLANVLDEVIDLQRLAEDLLHLARADAVNTSGYTALLDLDDVVLREARRIQERQRVDIELSAVSGAQVHGDARQLTRAVRNLLDNAERHAATQVMIRLREAHGMAVLDVVDDGPGVPAAETDRIFDRFARVDEARAAADGGGGLGLAITREIAGRHDGTVVLVASDRPGAVFRLTIPLAR